MAVTTPTGNSAEEIMTRAKVSDATRNIAPKMALSGSNWRWSGPNTSLTACGTTSPTNPISPLRLTAVAVIAAATIVVGWAWKIATWNHNDTLVPATTANSATGLKDGTIRSVEWPHTEENYVLKEMGFRIARKHAAKLRMMVHVLAFAVPLLAVLVSLFAGGILGVLAAVIAVLAQAPGILIERWLFFAEAKHAVTLYYGR